MGILYTKAGKYSQNMSVLYTKAGKYSENMCILYAEWHVDINGCFVR